MATPPAQRTSITLFLSPSSWHFAPSPPSSGLRADDGSLSGRVPLMLSCARVVRDELGEPILFVDFSGEADGPKG
jgi:hypothetical protein